MAHDQDRYITVTRYTRTGTFPLVKYNRYKFVTVILLKQPRNGRFRIETANWIQKWFKMPVGSSRKLYRHNSFSNQNGDDGRGYRNVYKRHRGSDLNQGD